MGITWPTKDEVLEKFLGWYRTFFPNTSTAKGTDAWKEGQSVSGIAGLIIARAKQIYIDMFVTTASGDALDRHGEVWLPEDKRRRPASGTTSGRITATGTPTAIPANTEWVHADGCRYYNPTAVGLALWGLTSVDINVLSRDTGQIANKSEGEKLTIVTPISGVDDEVTVTTGYPLAGARDQENHDEYRARLLSWLRYPPGGGNWGHYKNFAEGVGGCTKAFVYPCYDRNGDGRDDLGTVDVVCLGPGISDDAPTGDRFSVDEDAVWDELDEEVRPCTADLDDRPSDGGSGVAVPTAQVEPVTARIVPHEGYEGDWTGSYSALSMTGDKQINLSAPPVAIETNMRVLFNVQVGSEWQPCVRTVESKGANYIVVDEAFPSSTPDLNAGGLKPAGAGTEDQIDAILALFDGLTPGDTTGATRRPRVTADDPTDLIRADIVEVLQSLDSVKNSAVDQPAVDKEPTGPKYLIRNGLVYVTYVTSI